MRVVADNGWVLHLNGAEVARLRVRTDQDRVPSDGVALVSWEPSELAQTIWLDPRALRAGENVLAIN